MKLLTLTEDEQTRSHLMNLVLEGRVTVMEAANAMGLSERHSWRILKAYRERGASSLAHGNRGRRSPKVIPEELKQTMIGLARTKYIGLNHTHFSEMLAEREGITLSRSSVRKILIDAGIASRRRRRAPRARYRRTRIPQEGMLIQMDGSTHDWLEGRGPSFTLLLAVDDATGTVPHALFHKEEDTRGYFSLIGGIIRRRGVPLAIYTDRHAVFKPTHPVFGPKEDAGERRHTQFSRAMKQLSISMLIARTPQGKGRVEKMAGTFQDRLVSELRLAGVIDMEGANRLLEDFLPRFNMRFGVTPSQAGSAYRRLSPDINLSDVLCFHHLRKVLKDNTVIFRQRILQLLPDSQHISYAGKRVLLRERDNGRLEVEANERIVDMKEIPQRLNYTSAARQTFENNYQNIPQWLEDILRKKGTITETIAQPLLPDARQPTTRKQIRWDAVQEAKSRGLSIRAMAELLHMSRRTIRKYISTVSPPVYRLGHRTRKIATI